MWNKQRYCGQSQKYVWIQDLCRNKRKTTLFRRPDANISWKKWRKQVDLGEPTSFLDHVYLGCSQRVDSTPRNTAHTAQYSLFTSAERIARAWLKNCSVICVRLKRICHLVRSCLTCRAPRAHFLPHSLFLLPRHQNTHYNRDNTIYSTNTQCIINLSQNDQSKSNAIKNHSVVKTDRVAESHATHSQHNVNANLTRKLLRNTKRCSNHEFLLEQLRNCQGGKTSRKNCRVVLRHGRTRKENVWSDIASWLTKQLSSSTKSQLHALMTINSKKKNWKGWRIVKSMLSNCPEMSVLGTHWQTKHSLVCKTTCTKNHKMDQSVWQTLGSCWFLKYRTTFNNIVMWETLHNNASWDCSRSLTLPESLNTQSRPPEESCVSSEVTCLQVCSQKLDVWETNLFSHSSTESEIISVVGGLRMDGISALDLWDLLTEETMQGVLLRDTPSRKHTNSQTMTPIQYNDLEQCNVDYVSSNVKTSHSGAMLYIFENDEAVMKMIIKSRSPTMRHVSRTHRSRAWLGIWPNQPGPERSKSTTLTPKTNSQTSWQRAISHVMLGIIFSICSTLAISALPAALNWWRKRCREKQEKKQLWRSRCRRWTCVANCSKLCNSADFECF